jgi:hypothetical protein
VQGPARRAAHRSTIEDAVGVTVNWEQRPRTPTALATHVDEGVPMSAARPWVVPLAPGAGGERDAWWEPSEARGPTLLVDVACTSQSLLLARLCQLLHERPELRFMSVASQLEQGNLWTV